MSNVWETRHRLLAEKCTALVDLLGSDEPPESAMLYEQTVRLLLVVLRLLDRHRVNGRGRCRCCRRTTWGRFRQGSRQCTVLREVEFALGQGLDVVWWRLLGSAGRRVRLSEVRTRSGVALHTDD